MNNFQSSLSHVKFSEEFEFFTRVWLRVNSLPRNSRSKRHVKDSFTIFRNIQARAFDKMRRYLNKSCKFFCISNWSKIDFYAFLSFLRFLDCTKVKMNKKIFDLLIIIDVKFGEKELRIRLFRAELRNLVYYNS